MIEFGVKEIVILLVIIAIPIWYALKADFSEDKTFLEKSLLAFARFWAVLLAESVIVSLIGTYISTKSFLATILWAGETFSPFNISQFLVTCVLISPILLTVTIREKLKTRRQTREHSKEISGENSTE